MTRDMAAIARIHPLSGILSSFGVLLWCATVSICLFGAMAIRRRNDRGKLGLLLSSAALSPSLLADDFFMIHDFLAPVYFRFHEHFIFMSLGAAVLMYLFAFRKIIFQTAFGGLLLALGFLSVSVVTDTVLEPWFRQLGDWHYLFEDGSKWLGIACWCGYYSSTSYKLVMENWGGTAEV